MCIQSSCTIVYNLALDRDAGPYGLVEILGIWGTDSRDACPYNIMFAEQTFQETEGVISKNALRFISSIRLANAFQDGFAVISSPADW